jgi:translation initiation factor 2 beta subunit (eIF-2beta)/eIF-5
MGTLNVNRKVTDLYYRYKMPRICAKVEGKGNGIKTVIVNMADVAKALNRPATYPTKFFGCELGAQTQFDHKNERFIVNGSHDAAKLQDLLDGFIKKYVLCPECDNPETDLLISTKKEIISQTCKGKFVVCVHERRLINIQYFSLWLPWIADRSAQTEHFHLEESPKYQPSYARRFIDRGKAIQAFQQKS